MRNDVSNLGTPAGVAVGGEVVISAFLRRDGVSDSFDIGGIMLMKMHEDVLLVAEQEGHAIIMCGVDAL